MNELYLLQDGLGNGNYYVVAVGSNSRTAKSNTVEVSDIMASLTITGIKIVNNINIEVSVSAVDFNVGTPIRAILTAENKSPISVPDVFKQAISIYPSMPVVFVTQSITSYKLTIQPWTAHPSVSATGSNFTDIVSFFVAVAAGDTYSPYSIQGVTESTLENIPTFGLSINSYDKTANIAKFTAFTAGAIDASIDPRDLSCFGKASKPAGGSAQYTSPRFLKDIIGVGSGTFQAGLDALGSKDGDYKVFVTIPMLGSSGDDVINQFCLIPSYNGWFTIDAYTFYTIIRTNNFPTAQSNPTQSIYVQMSNAFNIKFTLDAPVLTYVASDRKLQWENVEGATSYDVYRDGEKVGSVSPSGDFTPVAKISTRTPLAVEMKPAGKPIEVEGKTIGYVDDKGNFTPVEKV